MRLGYLSWRLHVEQSQQWVEGGGERPTKAKMSKSQLKATLIVFFDIRSIIHREYVPAGQTVTGQFYVAVLKRLPARVFRVRSELTKDDKAPAHSSNSVQEVLAQKGIPALHHPPHSPDIASWDFFLFSNMKSHLKGTVHGGLKEVQEAVTVVLNGLTSEDYQGCFQSWEIRWNRCVELKGDYCEGSK